MNKKKRVAAGDPILVSEEADMVGVEALNPLGDIHGVSYKDSVLGQNAIGAGSGLGDGFASDDDEKDEVKSPDCPMIYLTKEEKAEFRRPWRQSLIIKVLGRRVGYTYLLNRIRSLWKPKALIEMMALENDYFLVRFASLMDYQYAAFEGPWVILDHYLVVKEWHPNFDPFKEKEEKLLVWVHFPCLPIELFREEFLMKVGAKIGRPVRVDDYMSITARWKFARMCVEIDITKPLLGKFKVNKRIRKIEYEGIHLVCFHCGKYDHKKEIYPSFIAEMRGAEVGNPDVGQETNRV